MSKSNETENKEMPKKENEIKKDKEEVKEKDKTENKKIKKDKKAKKVKNKIKSKESNKKIANKLKFTLYITLIILISLISFVGVYQRDKNKLVNKLPDYILGTDIDEARNIVIKVDTSTTKKTYDANGNEINTNSTNTDTTAEGVTTKEIPANDDSVLTTDNYQKTKDIIEQRLKYMNVEYYELKFDESDGTIYLEVPENTDTDYIAQYCVTKGLFQVTDNDTGEVLLSNSDIKNAKVQYSSGSSTSSSGTSVYLSIQFNKDGTNKLKDMSNTYVKTTDESGNSTSKKVKMTLDDQTIMTTTFDEEITNGTLQLSLGTSTDSTEIKNYAKQASNVAVFLNTEAMPITYKSDVNRLVYSDFTSKTLLTIIIVFASIYLLLVIYTILKYKKLGVLGAITEIGFVALLLIIIRYANVTVTLLGICTILVAAIYEYKFITDMLKTYSEKLNMEEKNKAMGKTMNVELEKLIPIAIIGIVFSVMKWQPIYSMGMILFWAVIELIIYNEITVRIICPKEKLPKKEN